MFASWVDIVCGLVTLPCAALAIAIVRGIDANQEERIQAIGDPQQISFASA